MVPLSASLDELKSLVDCTKNLIEAPHLSEGSGKERETTGADIFRAGGPKLKQMAFHSRYASPKFISAGRMLWGGDLAVGTSPKLVEGTAGGKRLSLPEIAQAVSGELNGEAVVGPAPSQTCDWVKAPRP